MCGTALARVSSAHAATLSQPVPCADRCHPPRGRSRGGTSLDQRPLPHLHLDGTWRIVLDLGEADAPQG